MGRRERWRHIPCVRTHIGPVRRPLLPRSPTRGPAVMSNRTGWIALAAAAMALIGTATSASAREVVRYEGAVQPGTKTAERQLYLVLGEGTAIRYTVAVGRP